MERTKAVEQAVKECIEEGVLAEYLEDNASEVINVLVQEWDWEKYGDARERAAEKRERAKWKTVIDEKDTALANKDAEIANKDAEIAALKAKISTVPEHSQ